MAGNIKYQTGTLTSLLDQTGSAPNTLAALAASGGGAITTSSFDNTPATLGAFWGDFEANILFATAPAANDTLDLYIVESVDGSNFSAGTGSNTPANVVAAPNAYVGSFVVPGTASGNRLIVRNIPLPPTKFNVLIVNNSAKALASASFAQTLKVLPYYEQYT